MTELLGSPDALLAEGKAMAVDLAMRALDKIPAYRAHIGHQTVGNWDDFAALPTTSKQNYLKLHPLADLCWNGVLDQPSMVCSTSGSTGEPFYFPRSSALAEGLAEIYGPFLRRSSYGAGPTLAIVAFGMGVWIGGTITVRALEIVQERDGFPVSILPTGVNQVEILSALKCLAPQYGQTVLYGYPPFVREVLVRAESEGIDLAALNLRLSFAAEAFSDDFRDFVCQVGAVRNPLVDTLNVYGSADLGGMAAETPTSILLRSVARQDPDLFERLFGEIDRTPTVAQFAPDRILFEALEGELAITGDSSLPLIRYRIGDKGGVLSFAEAQGHLAAAGLDLEVLCREAGIETDRRPFVYVYERIDLSCSLYGLIVYPEYLKHGLESHVRQAGVTGKFTMTTTYTAEQEQYLEVYVEALGHADLDTAPDIEASLVHGLMKQSSEFRELHTQLGEGRRLVRVTLCDRGSAPHFLPGGKQRWAIPGQKEPAE